MSTAIHLASYRGHCFSTVQPVSQHGSLPLTVVDRWWVSAAAHSPCRCRRTSQSLYRTTNKQVAYLSSSFALDVVVFFLLGTGILHSMAKATQFVHGTPSEAASQRTCGGNSSQTQPWPGVAMFAGTYNHIPFAHDMSAGSSIMLVSRSFRRACFIVQPRLPRSSVWIAGK